MMAQHTDDMNDIKTLGHHPEEGDAADLPQAPWAEEVAAAEDVADADAPWDEADGTPDIPQDEADGTLGAPQDEGADAQDAPQNVDAGAPDVPQPSEDQGAAAEQAPAPSTDETLADTAERSADMDETVRTEGATGPTSYMPKPEDSPLPEADASFRDVADAAGRYARVRVEKARTLLGSHGLLIGLLCGIAILAIFVGVVFAQRLANYPDVELVQSDARSRLAHPGYEPGEFDSAEPLTLTAVDVADKHKQASKPDECEVTVLLGYANGSIESTQRATMSYELKDGAWSCVDVSKPTDTVYTATAGVSDAELMANVSEVLRKAERSIAEGGEGSNDMSLLTLYRNAEVSIVDRDFDADRQTYATRVHLTRTSTFTGYECDVTANFTFRQGNGKWELTKASASDGAKDLVLTPLMGSWVGTFQSQEATDPKCYGAKGTQLHVTVTSVEGSRISGTLSGIAHFHEPGKEEVEATEGDVEVSELAFSGKLDREASGISFTCTTPEDSRGSLRLRLDFGLPNDPSAASATLTTTVTMEGSFLFVPYEWDVRYADSYSLVRE